MELVLFYELFCTRLPWGSFLSNQKIQGPIVRAYNTIFANISGLGWAQVPWVRSPTMGSSGRQVSTVLAAKQGLGIKA